MSSMGYDEDELSSDHQPRLGWSPDLQNLDAASRANRSGAAAAGVEDPDLKNVIRTFPIDGAGPDARGFREIPPVRTAQASTTAQSLRPGVKVVRDRSAGLQPGLRPSSTSSPTVQHPPQVIDRGPMRPQLVPDTTSAETVPYTPVPNSGGGGGGGASSPATTSTDTSNVIPLPSAVPAPPQSSSVGKTLVLVGGAGLVGWVLAKLLGRRQSNPRRGRRKSRK